MRKLSQDQILDAQQTLCEHIDATRPTHTDTTLVNDWRPYTSRTTAPRIDICAARQAAWKRIAAANAKQ